MNWQEFLDRYIPDLAIFILITTAVALFIHWLAIIPALVYLGLGFTVVQADERGIKVLLGRPRFLLDSGLKWRWIGFEKIVLLKGASINSSRQDEVGYLKIQINMQQARQQAIQTTIDKYADLIKKHDLNETVERLKNVGIPNIFKLDLLEILIARDEKQLQEELDALKAELMGKPRPAPESEPTKRAVEERERTEERDVWFESELAKEVYDGRSLRQKIKKEKEKVLSQLEKKEIMRAEALQTIDDLEKAEQRILKKLEMKGMMD